MKKKIIIGVLIGLILICICMFLTDKYMVEHRKEPIFVYKKISDNDSNSYTAKGLFYSIYVQKNVYSDIEKIEMYIFDKCIAGAIANIDYLTEEKQDNSSRVIIKNKEIKNEDLIDKFIQNASRKIETTLEIEIDGQISKLEFIESEFKNTQENEDANTTIVTIPPYTGHMSMSFDLEYAKKYYGYYKITNYDGTVDEYSSLGFTIKRIILEENVIVYFDYIGLVDTIEPAYNIHRICEYNLNSSLYKKNYDLTYLGRKDMGIKQIAKTNQFDNIDYGLYTLGGDVIITVEEDMVYSLEDALKENIITVQSILDQAKLDEKYGVCEAASYNDGGSIEYRYKDYTILKFNTLNENRDLIIGFPETIINTDTLKNEKYKE